MRVMAIATLLLAAGVSRAGDLNIQVLLSGQVAPGVYGQVVIGKAPPPPLVFAQPMMIQAVPSPPPPIYLHVPPGHAKNWHKYCHQYNACNRPVYFVRSAEYEPGYVPHEHGHDNDHEHHGDEHHGDDDQGHGHAHDHDDHD